MRLEEKWTGSEVSILRYYYSDTIQKILLELLPRRTYKAIRSKAKKLGIRRKFRDTSICRKGHLKSLHSKCYECYDNYQRKLKERDPIFFARAQRKYKKNHPEKVKQKQIHDKLIYRKQWLSYFVSKHGDTPHCEICQIPIFWEHPKHRNRACFDHRVGGEIIKKSPRTWIQNKPCNEKNIKIFESCNFGLLCNQCNLLLPSDIEYRSLMARNIIKYLEK